MGRLWNPAWIFIYIQHSRRNPSFTKANYSIKPDKSNFLDHAYCHLQRGSHLWIIAIHTVWIDLPGFLFNIEIYFFILLSKKERKEIKISLHLFFLNNLFILL